MPKTHSHQDFLIDDIMPEREVHLLAGPSGAGKSTLAIQEFIRGLLEGKVVLGKTPHPRGVAYVSCDRSSASFHRSLDRHALAWGTFPHAALRDIPRGGKSRIWDILSWTQIQGVHFIIIDGFASLIPDGKLSDYSMVSAFLVECQRICENWDLTILGVVHATKVKESEKISNPRQRILGSVAWAAYSDLVIVIDEEDPEDSGNQVRRVDVLPRDSGSFTLRLNMNSFGHLVSVEDEAQAELEGVLDLELRKLPMDSEVRTQDLIHLGFNLSVSRPSTERWISTALMSGRLERVRRGVYRRISIA